jgi:hypothetical protein
LRKIDYLFIEEKERQTQVRRKPVFAGRRLIKAIMI